jgi:hypothetical protein
VRAPDVAAPVEVLGDQVRDEVLLRVHGVHLARAELAVVQLELAVLTAERTHTVRMSFVEHSGAEPVLGQHPGAVRAQEPGPGPGLHLFPARPFDDDGPDSRCTQQVP